MTRLKPRQPADRTITQAQDAAEEQSDPRIIWHQGTVRREQRATQGLTVWLTGLPGSGKSSVAVELERLLVELGCSAYRLDGDNLRMGLNSDLRFSPADRQENSRRVSEMARLFADAGVIAIVSLVSPKRAARAAARAIHEQDGLTFVEVFVDTPLEVCEEQDPKGVYARARAGALRHFVGVNAAYEAPQSPDLVLRRSEHGDAAAMARMIVERVRRLR